MNSNLKYNCDINLQLNQGKFSISIANDTKTIDECLRLRHDVFST